MSAEAGAKELSGPGERLLADVFRRADKNDDEQISSEEFRAYFRDTHLRSADYERLFRAVDADHSGSIDISELFAFFAKEFGPFAKTFAATENLHDALTATLRETHAQWSEEQADDDVSFQRRFQTRVLMRELLTQLDAAQAVVEGALEHLDRAHPADTDLHDAAADAADAITAPFHFLSTELPPSYGHGNEAAAALAKQVDRLARLVSKLDNSNIRIQLPETDVIAESAVDDETDAFVVVQRTMQPTADHEADFLKALRKYARETKSEVSARHVYARELGKKGTWVVYEIWNSVAGYKDHFRTSHSRGFAAMLSDLLDGPEQVHTMCMPASFFSAH